MRLGQERVDLVACRVVTNGVGAFFRLHSLQALHRIGIEKIDCARISTSHVEMFPMRVVEYSHPAVQTNQMDATFSAYVGRL